MINRRHIRVKVMQSIYAMLHSKNEDLMREKKFLYYSIAKMLDMYVLQLLLLIKVQKLAIQKLEIAKKKHLATKEDLHPNKRFINNSFLKKLAESASIKLYTEKNKLDNWELDDEYIKIIWDELKKSNLYKDYMSLETSNFKEDKSFVINFYKEIIAPNEKLADYYEDKLITWVDDIPFVNTWIVRSLNKVNKHNPFVLCNLYKDENDEEFVAELFTKTILNHHQYEKDIQEKTPNWEKDRIANIDMILIKMAICEFLKFPSIPTRVTINEYIEIAKDYSTEKSSYFINGVLDKLSKEYTKNKTMVKLGRGLL